MNAPAERVRFGVDRTGSQNVLAGQTVTLISFPINSGGEFVMTEFATYAGAAGAFGTPGLAWTIKIDGMPHPDYQNMRDQFGSQQQLRTLADKRLRANNLVEVVVTNDSATAYTAGATFRGYVH